MLIYQAALEHVKERLQGKHVVANFGDGDFIVGIGISEDDFKATMENVPKETQDWWIDNKFDKIIQEFVRNPWFMNKDGYLTCTYEGKQNKFDYADPRFFDKLDEFLNEVIIPAVPSPISSTA